MYFDEGAAATMNVSGGFTDLSFYYSSVSAPGFVNVWSGADSTGTLLATLVLPITPFEGPGCSGIFCPYFPVTVPFVGLALSADFGGDSGNIAFDSITINAAAVPVPAALPLFASGLGLVAWASRRRKKTAIA
jgi:hypothetical protein